MAEARGRYVDEDLALPGIVYLDLLYLEFLAFAVNDGSSRLHRLLLFPDSDDYRVMLAVAGMRRQKPTLPVQPPPSILRAAPGAGEAPPRISFHDLQLTCASLLFQRNVHTKLVRELLGYASVAITLDTYSHMLPGMGDEAADAMGEALG